MKKEKKQSHLNLKNKINWFVWKSLTYLDDDFNLIQLILLAQVSWKTQEAEGVAKPTIYDRFGLLDNGLQRKIELEEASSDWDGVRDVVILGNQVLTQGTRRRQLVSQWVSVSESLSDLVSQSVKQRLRSEC